MGTIETGKIISAIRKRKNMSENDIATESKFNKQYTIEDYNYDYLQGTIICFILTIVALYLSLIGWYMIQAVSMMLVVISFCVFYLYDEKYSNLLNTQATKDLSIQASCRQFILLTGITVSLFVNLINMREFLIGDKYFISQGQLLYALMVATFYTVTNLFLFYKSSKNNYTVPLYFHIGAILTILSSLIIIIYQIYIKIHIPNTIDSNKILQNKTNRLFILLMVICIIYSLLTFTLRNISNKYKVMLFVLSIVQHSVFLLAGRYSIWFSNNAETNVHGGIYMGYIVIALTISMTVYYLQTCISRRTNQ